LPATFNVETLGQVFTPKSIAKFMAGLRKTSGIALEPSCGNGVFLEYLAEFKALEIDPTHAPKDSIILDFFNLSAEEKFECVIGNPPYVRYQDIPEDTKMLLNENYFDKRTNLYLFFIEKSIRHLAHEGELIFIVPREFIKSTASKTLNEKIFEFGTVTHLVDFGDSKIFTNAVPNCVVFRFEKGDFTRKTLLAEVSMKSQFDTSPLETIEWKTADFQCLKGQLLFTTREYPIHLNEIASVKVGAVSGADHIFANDDFGNMDFVYSGTVKDGSVRRMYWPVDSDHAKLTLSTFKAELLLRGIRKFTEADWWNWGRGFPLNTKKRIYVNSKTRNGKPFFVSDCNNFDGSVLAIFPHNQDINISDFCKDLNEVDWQELGFQCDGRYIFAQRSLENSPLPKNFTKYL
jgi:adenine-specific DNA-methyltransferase